MRHASNMSSFLSYMSIIITIILKIGSIRISLSTSIAIAWRPRKAIPRQVRHHDLHVPTQLKHVEQVCMGGFWKTLSTRRVSCKNVGQCKNCLKIKIEDLQGERPWEQDIPRH
jgi:hypothetical protein